MASLKVPVSARDHILGPADATVTLVEYGDYECPHCAAAQPTVVQIQQSFSRILRFVFRHFPLTEIHPHAQIAAEGAEFAAGAGMFWQMHEALFQNQEFLNASTVLLIGSELGLPSDALRVALQNGQYRDKVRSDFLGGVRSGVNGTPAFFINGLRHDGPYDFASLAASIQAQAAANAHP